MPKRKGAKKRRKAPRKTPRPKPREARTDKRGIPLTSDRHDFAVLPSDLSAAWRPPAGAPTKATAKMDPAMPTTVIPELNAIEITPFAYQTVVETIEADRIKSSPAPATRTQKLAKAMKLTGQALGAWMSLLHAPAIAFEAESDALAR